MAALSSRRKPFVWLQGDFPAVGKHCPPSWGDFPAVGKHCPPSWGDFPTVGKHHYGRSETFLPNVEPNQ